jgi:hypothetical protein
MKIKKIDKGLRNSPTNSVKSMITIITLLQNRLAYEKDQAIHCL